MDVINGKRAAEFAKKASAGYEQPVCPLIRSLPAWERVLGSLPPAGIPASSRAEGSGAIPLEPGREEHPPRRCLADGSRAAGPIIPDLRICLLSGGLSRRMGRDKALLPHPQGGNWLARTLVLLAQLDAPLTLVSADLRHHQLAAALARGANARDLEQLIEATPPQGPLMALRRLMELHSGKRLLLTPVDMPWLELPVLQTLLENSLRQPGRILVAHDGERLQPLLGIYPATAALLDSIGAFTDAGGRSLQRWLGCLEVADLVDVRVLPAGPLRNANHPSDLEDLWGGQPPAAAGPPG